MHEGKAGEQGVLGTDRREGKALEKIYRKEKEGKDDEIRNKKGKARKKDKRKSRNGKEEGKVGRKGGKEKWEK